MTDKSRGWFYVAMQFVLIFLLVLSPRMDSPYGGASEVVGTIGVGIIALGSGLLLFSFLGLGNSLTALPVPKEKVVSWSPRAFTRGCATPSISRFL